MAPHFNILCLFLTAGSPEISEDEKEEERQEEEGTATKKTSRQARNGEKGPRNGAINKTRLMNPLKPALPLAGTRKKKNDATSKRLWAHTIVASDPSFKDQLIDLRKYHIIHSSFS